MIDTTLLLNDTKKQVVAVIDDLRRVAATDRDAAAHVATEFQRAHAAGRTGFGQAEWAEGLYAQVAVAWVLGCVFVRFCEDNDLIEDPLLGGPGIRSQIALDHRAAHLQANPAHDDRHWLRDVFARLRDLPATGEIFGPHNLVWADDLLPSADAARKLREELTRVDPESGELRHDFTDSTWNTRFLGDLYQDLSEHAKKSYALLQTPIFIEDFILDRTLDPAIATFGLAGTTIIDPTCGSGHFLLGSFSRLFGRWVDAEPSTNRRVLARRALDAIGGIDLNPFAASIARFRLLVAALRAGGDSRLADAPAYEIYIAVGDSLLHGDPPDHLPGMAAPGEEEALLSSHHYESEDLMAARALLQRRWSAVVGNPPYIVCADAALNKAYRGRFSTCYRKYSLAVPFMERFWQLAQPGSRSTEAGYIGMITANSFMKREMGRRLVAEWFPTRDLTHVIDSNGLRMEGHPTPTVILLGRARSPVSDKVRVVMGRKGEPPGPLAMPGGVVWQSIGRHVDLPDTGDDFVDVVDMERERLRHHPWSLGGLSATKIKDIMDSHPRRLAQMVETIGFFGISGMEEFSTGPPGSFRRLGFAPAVVRRLVGGDSVRDWSISLGGETYLPYTHDLVVPLSELDDGGRRCVWCLRALLEARATFSGETYKAAGRSWWDWHQYAPGRSGKVMIKFAEVATHNHFAFAPSDVAFAQAAPLLVRPNVPEDELFGLVALLNSAVGAFWTRQVCQPRGAGQGAGEPWQQRVQRDGTKLKRFPITNRLPAELGRLLHDGAQQRSDTFQRLTMSVTPTSAALATAERESAQLLTEMIGAQERLDWECYRLYGFVEDDLTTGIEPEPSLQLGERAFEIVLARRIAAGEEESTWFVRHGSTPITDLPSHWSPAYRHLVERRIELIESNTKIGLIERPEYKRRWATQSWGEQIDAALKNWLLDRLEECRYWPKPAGITTVARLTAEARSDEDFLSVARLYSGRDDLDLAAMIADLVKGESVPYLAAHRYTDSGLRKHDQWLTTWELQRREDASEDVGTILVPPKYGKPDFKGVGWEHRGKLDVPKERFVSYPGAERETDASMVIGWAGWKHLDRARALAAWYLQARRDGRDAEHLTPLLAGLAELVPWLKQWYDEPNADPALDRPGTQIAALVEAELRTLSLTAADLSAWPPAKMEAGRPRKATT